nr:MAG TPA: REGULATORY PROTEIN SWI6-CYCLE, REGULATION [Caudoviricetes sp.]
MDCVFNIYYIKGEKYVAFLNMLNIIGNFKAVFV